MGIHDANREPRKSLRNQSTSHPIECLELFEAIPTFFHVNADPANLNEPRLPE